MSVARSLTIKGRSHVAATLVAPAIFVAGVIVGWTSLTHSELLGTGGWIEPEPAAFGELFWPILGRNLSAALLLFSGVYTAGFSTIIALGLLSTYVGATFGAAAGNVGVTDALLSIVVYAPIEFAGLLLAATAGIMPVAAFVRSAFADRTDGWPFASYVAEIGPALSWFCYAVVLIVLGAAVESAVISLR